MHAPYIHETIELLKVVIQERTPNSMLFLCPALLLVRSECSDTGIPDLC
jgi:hypothetical protein